MEKMSVCFSTYFSAVMRRLDGHHSAWEFPKVQHTSGPGGKIRDSISDIGPGGVASALSKIQRAITKPLNPGR